MQLTGVFWVVLFFVVNAQGFEIEDKHREKRQTSFGFSVNADKETFLQSGGVNLVQLTGMNTMTVELASSSVNATCNLGLGTITVTGGITVPNVNVDQCSDLTANGQLTVSDEDSTASFIYSGPGTLYVGPDLVFFADAAQSGLINFIAASRSTFVPVLPDVEVLYPLRSSTDLTINLDTGFDGGDGIALGSDDGLILTGADCTMLEFGDSVTYSGSTLTVRRGPTVIIRPTPGSVSGFDVVLDQTIAGQLCRTLDREEVSRSGFLSGPGLICTGTGGFSNAFEAFFTNSTSLINEIMDEVVDRQLRCEVNANQEPIIMGNFQFTDQVINLLDAQLLTFPNADTKELNNDGNVVIRDRFGIVLQQYQCSGVSVTLSCFHLNELMRFPPATTSGGTLQVPDGGLSVYFDPQACAAFTFPTANTRIRALADQCIEDAMVTPAPPVTFSFTTNSLGSSTLFANGMSVLTPSSSMSFSVGNGQYLTYNNRAINVFNSGTGDLAFSLSGNISSFTANTAPNSLTTFSNSASGLAFNGPGTIYVDNGNRAFYTTSGTVTSLIQNSISTAVPRTVDILPGMSVNGMPPPINLQSGGTTFFQVTPNTRFETVQGSEGLAYVNQVPGIAQAEMVPGNTQLTYVPSESLITVTGAGGEPRMNITDVNNLFIQQQIGGNLVMATAGVTFPGGGILYRGTTMDFYLRSSILRPDDFQMLLDINNIRDISGGNSIEQGTFYDGTSIQTLQTSSMTLLGGPGFVLISEDSFFYTDVPSFGQSLPGQISSLRPSQATFNIGTGLITFQSSGTGGNTTFGVGSRRVQVPDARVFYDGQNVTSEVEGNNLLASPVSSLFFFDGVQLRQVDATSDPQGLPGGGLLIVDENTGQAFYTIDPTTIDQLTGIFDDVLDSLIAPNIPNTPPTSVTSKLNTLEAGFGQFLTVYEGANITFVCDAGNPVPPAEISFSIDSMPLDDAFVTSTGPNTATAEVTASRTDSNNGTFEITCTARNEAGSDTRTTRVRVRPREPVTIDSFFHPGLFGQRVAVVVARDANAVPGDVDRFINLNPGLQNITPILPPDDADQNNPTVIDDMSQLMDMVVVACRANGRPQPSITWRVSVGGGARQSLGSVFTSFNITEPRQGQSLVTVITDGGLDTSCYTFICIANNGGDENPEGQAIVCPQRFRSEGDRITSDCSVSCGIGVQRVTFAYNRLFNDMSSIVTFDELPPGLVKEMVDFCTPQEDCPVVTFQYQVGNFSECTEFCGRGEQTRDVTCNSFIDGMNATEVEDENCGGRRPEETVACNVRPCPVYSANDEFGMCSVSCGGGVRTRNISCLMANNDTGIFDFTMAQTVDLELCRNFSTQVAPPVSEPCNMQACPVRFLPGEWEECDQFFCQERSVSCVNFDPADPLEAWPADESACMGANLIRPVSVRDCGGGQCHFGAWRTEDVGVCSEICGPGLQMRDVICTNLTESDPEMAAIEEGYCDSTQRPAESVECFLQNCPGRCDVEPNICSLIRMARLCKDSSLASITSSCCKSCPFQATPIPPPTPLPTEATTTPDVMVTGATTPP